MFNRTVVTPPSVTVNVPAQKPIDPSDAARFYAECMDRARKEIAAAVVVQLGARNEIAAVLCQHQRHFDTDNIHVRLIFKINDELYDMEVVDTAEAMAVATYDVILRQIIAQLVPFAEKRR